MTALNRVITREINQHGPITFARFMELTLYHPRYGYYTSPGTKIGRSGDFYTAPTVSELFGAMVARQLEEMWRLAGRPARWALVEFGPGTGKLAGDIMNALLQEHHDFYRAVTYHLVEISPSLLKEQQAILQAHQAAAKFKWVQDVSQIDGGGFEGCVLANELVDALPVHLVKQSGGRLRELLVDLGDGDKFCLVENDPTTPAIADYFADQGVALDEGQRAEVNLNAADWLAMVAKHLNRGFVLLIDYGAEAGHLYGPHRFNGTLRCFHKHRLTEDPLVNVGGQDITAHVNFTSLTIQGQRANLQSQGMVSQPQFLLNLGILDTVKEHNDFTPGTGLMKKTSAIKQLVLPGGMGDIFKVLIFSKGLGSPTLTGITGPGK